MPPWLFCTYQFVLLNPFTFFTPFPGPLPSGKCSLYLWVCFCPACSFILFFFPPSKKFVVIVTRGHAYWFWREGKGGRETLMRERNINGLPLTCAPSGDWTCNPGLCPDQESNWQPLGLQDDAQGFKRFCFFWEHLSIYSDFVWYLSALLVFWT